MAFVPETFSSPLVGPALAKSGGSLLIRKGDGVVGRLDESLIRRIWKEVGCFVAGTPVATESGRRSIDSICAGERVWAYDPNSKRWTLEPVVQPLTREYTGDFVTVGVEGGSPVTATGNHPFWVVEGDALDGRPEPGDVPAEERQVQGGRWVEARHLLVGDRLCLRSGSTVRVDRLDVEYGCRTVYNLHVERIHSYAVGEQSILVHNNTDECAKIIQEYVEGIPSPRGLRDTSGGASEFSNWLKKWRFGPGKASTARPLELRSFFGPNNKEIFERLPDGTRGGDVRDFDMFVRGDQGAPDAWYEVKSGNAINSQNRASFRDELERGKRIAASHGARYGVICNPDQLDERVRDMITKEVGIDLIWTRGD